MICSTRTRSSTSSALSNKATDEAKAERQRPLMMAVEGGRCLERQATGDAAFLRAFVVMGQFLRRIVGVAIGRRGEGPGKKTKRVASMACSTR